MERHPGGEVNTLALIRRSGLAAGSSILDMGAGAGDTVALLQKLGFQSFGIDLKPRGPSVEELDYLGKLPWEGCFDGVISQCSFYCSGNPRTAMAQAYRVLKPNGILMLSDVCPADSDMGKMAEDVGFRILYREDQTPQWKQYYIQALWRGEVPPAHGGGKYRYEALVCRKIL